MTQAREFLAPSLLCNCSQLIVQTARRIGGDHPTSVAVRQVFYWVRDNIQYTVGLDRLSAEGTLLKGSGSCTNKANLMVALLRCLSVPAGFRVMEVVGQAYFGPLCTDTFRQFVSQRSLHVYATAFLNGRWVKLDCSDDIQLCSATQHLCKQTTPAEFDGTHDAVLHLDPEHVISDSIGPLPSVDHILEKQLRVSRVAVEVGNMWVAYVRRFGIRFSNIQEAERQFFAQLEQCDPNKYRMLISLLGARNEAMTAVQAA